MLGLGLWNYPPLISYLAEGIALVAGLVVYLRVTKGDTLAGKYGVIILVVILFLLNVMFTFGPTPTNPQIPAALALTLYLLIAGVAFWLDRKRS
jgi:hypothetical protein